MMLNKKGNAFVWVAGIISLIAIALAFISVSPVMNALSGLNDSMTVEQNATWLKINNVWWMWPAIALVGVILWVFVRTLRNDTFGGYG